MNIASTLPIAAVATAAIVSVSSADIIFSDNFENGLGQWTGKGGGAHHGVLVIDPHDSNNTALSFSGLNSAGDMFMADAMTIDPGETYRLSFDYLGLAREGTLAGNTGGYVGFSVGTPSTHTWQWATGSASGAQDVLIDDGQWHSYDFQFTGADLGIGNSLRLMVEDFSGSRGSGGDAYFDNFSIGTVAVPTPGGLAVIGLGGLIIARRRQS